jgi:methylated-DNA-[protein]-cysteine S-methyltransferase
MLAQMSDLAAMRVATPIGVVGIVASRDGLRRVLLPGDTRVEPPAAGSEAASAIAHEAAIQLAEYAEGERREFELPLDWSGVDVRHHRVLDTLVEVAPYGHTVTYGELGKRVGEEDARAIGVLMARNPIPLVVPCHRVVAADGLGGYGGGVELKRTLLELEHVLPPRLPL